MYHITEAGPRVCKSVMGKCPYANEKDSHFNDQASAHTEYEKRLVDKYGVMGKNVADKNNQSALQKHYRRLEKLEQNSPIYRAIAQDKRLRMYTPTNRDIRLAYQRNNRDGSNRRRSRTVGSAIRRASSRLLRKQMQKFTRAITPNRRNIKKMLLVKYWMPDIRSNKWR